MNKNKIILFLAFYITLFLVIETPTLGLMIISSNTQYIQTQPNIENGFIGSSYVMYSLNPIINNSTVIGYAVITTTFNFGSVMLLFFPIFCLFLIGNSNKKTEKKEIN